MQKPPQTPTQPHPSALDYWFWSVVSAELIGFFRVLKASLTRLVDNFKLLSDGLSH